VGLRPLIRDFEKYLLLFRGEFGRPMLFKEKIPSITRDLNPEPLGLQFATIITVQAAREINDVQFSDKQHCQHTVIIKKPLTRL
jgi:hypothetical protein